MSDIVLVQNQAGRRGKKWDRSGVVVEILDHDQYRIKVNGMSLKHSDLQQFATEKHSDIDDVTIDCDHL